MKIGPVIITTVRKAHCHEEQIREQFADWLRYPEGREVVARVARSVAKDYIQDHYENAEVPFK